MAQVKYVGPWDAAELPHLDDLGLSVFKNGESKEVPDDRLGTLRESPDWEVDGKRGESPAPTPEPEVHTTAPDNQPTVPDPAEPAAAPAEGN